MNIFGLGPLEILLVVVLALIVFGPAKLPEIMGQVGRAIADFRRATSDLSDEFNRTIQAELAETRAVVDETKSAVSGVHTSINTAIGAAPALTTPAPAPTLAASPTNGASANNGVASNGTTAASAVATEEKPPLADTSQWSWETAAPTPATPVVETLTSEPSATTPTQKEPATASAEEPAQRVSKSRRLNGRDDLLPPY